MKCELNLKPLFNEWEGLSGDAMDFQDKVRSFLEPLIAELDAQGFRMRDVESIVISTVSDIATANRLMRNTIGLKKLDAKVFNAVQTCPTCGNSKDCPGTTINPYGNWLRYICNNEFHSTGKPGKDSK
jgi:hypothetical protein